MIWGALVGGIVDLGKGMIERKKAKDQAKHDRDIAKINHEASWDQIQAQNSANSWKDEWFVIILSIPMVGAFIPDLVPHIEAGFAALDRMPDYYKAFLGSAIAASFGIKAISKWGK